MNFLTLKLCSVSVFDGMDAELDEWSDDDVVYETTKDLMITEWPGR